MTSNEVLLILLEVLQEYYAFGNCAGERERAGPSESRAIEVPPPSTDVNNNDLVADRDAKNRKNFGANVTGRNFRGVDDTERATGATADRNCGATATDPRAVHAEDARTNDECTCDDVKRCNANSASDCCANCVPRSIDDRVDPGREQEEEEEVVEEEEEEEGARARGGVRVAAAMVSVGEGVS